MMTRNLITKQANFKELFGILDRNGDQQRIFFLHIWQEGKRSPSPIHATSKKRFFLCFTSSFPFMISGLVSQIWSKCIISSCSSASFIIFRKKFPSTDQNDVDRATVWWWCYWWEIPWYPLATQKECTYFFTLSSVISSYTFLPEPVAYCTSKMHSEYRKLSFKPIETKVEIPAGRILWLDFHFTNHIHKRR